MTEGKVFTWMPESAHVYMRLKSEALYMKSICCENSVLSHEEALLEDQYLCATACHVLHKSLSFPQPIECVAAIAWEAEKPLDVTTVIVDPPKAGEVRVKARFFAAAACLPQA